MSPARLRNPVRCTLKEPSLLMARKSGPLYWRVKPGSKEESVDEAGVIVLSLRQPPRPVKLPTQPNLIDYVVLGLTPGWLMDCNRVRLACAQMCNMRRNARQDRDE